MAFSFLTASRLVALAVFFLFTLTGALPAAPHDDLLARERWREASYGVSLRPPLGSRIVEQTADDALVRIGAEGYSFSVSIRKTSRDLAAADMAATAIEQVALAEPTSVILDQPTVRPAGRPGALVYFDIRERRVVLGHLFMQIDPRTFVMLRLECDQARFPQVRRVFDAVAASLEIADPAEMDRLREEQLRAGEAWRVGLDRARLKARLTPEQWYRIQGADDQDIGYLVIRMTHDQQMDQPGVSIELQGRMILRDQAIDTLSTFFESDDAATEIWSIKTTIRPPDGQKPGRRVLPGEGPGKDGVTWVETGLRAVEMFASPEKSGKTPPSQQVITVTRQAPGKGPEELKWGVPPRGYLSQTLVFLLPQLIDAGQEGTLGFYAYAPAAGKLLYRTERVSRRDGGGFALHSRQGPDQDEQVTEFDARGNMLRRQLPDGMVMLPATKQEIARVWKVR